MNRDIKLTSVAKTFEQDADCCAPSDSQQFIEISTSDGGGGKYFIIKTERWAFDSMDEVITLLKKFEAEVNESGK